MPKLAWQHIIRLSFEVRATVTFEDGKIVCVQKAKKEGQKSTRVINCCICICCIAITRWTKMTNSFFRTELELFSVTFFPFSVWEGDEWGWWDGLHNDHRWVFCSDDGGVVIVMVMEFNGDGDGGREILCWVEFRFNSFFSSRGMNLVSTDGSDLVCVQKFKRIWDFVWNSF